MRSPLLRRVPRATAAVTGVVVTVVVTVTALAPFAGPTRAAAEDPPPAAAAAAAPIVPSSWLTLEGPDLRIRRPISPSAVFARHLLDRQAAPPRAGDEVTGERGVAVRWTEVAAKDGKLPASEAAWAFTTVDVPTARVVLAKVTGAATLWVNGDPFVGDVYGYGFPGVPVALAKGPNRVFVSGLRGDVTVEFHDVAPGVRPVAWDATVQDYGSRAFEVLAGVVLLNASTDPAAVWVGRKNAWGPGSGPLVRLPPLGITKAPVRVEAWAPSKSEPGLVIACGTGAVADAPGPSATATISVDVATPQGPRRVVRVSAIDGSVQEYAVVEPAPTLDATPPRVVLSLHGAGVACVNQARAYSRHPGTWIVCPTNRRPFGFDWQDWGRTDAYETLDHFRARFAPGVARVALTGHSMGGHGTWHLAANDPDRFCVIAPSAGWASFDTYGPPRPPSPLAAFWRGADAGSDTLSLATNLAPIPAYVLHGTADDNVPLAQAELMLRTLRDAGGAPASHFEEGAGHWWDGEAAAGADCVDWPAIFDLVAATDPAAPAPTTLDWTTVDPSVDASHHWLGVATPLVYGAPIRIRAAWDAGAARLTVTTTNARRIDVGPPGVPEHWTVVVDGQEFAVGGVRVWLERWSDGWTTVGNLPDERKKPSRSGPLKRALSRRFALVMPTQGNEAETRETHARLRFDAAQWWYRANGFADVVLDTEVLAEPARFELRNLVLYGNSDTNAAWRRVLGDGPVDVGRDEVRVGGRVFVTDAAACFFVRPRADDAMGVAAALGDTGPRGCRLAMTHAVFISGAGYPDYLGWDARALTSGEGGVLAAGWFDADWKLDGRGFLAPAAKAAEETK